jgi:hypothetical protein
VVSAALGYDAHLVCASEEALHHRPVELPDRQHMP